jgi:hypothetical protein
VTKYIFSAVVATAGTLSESNEIHFVEEKNPMRAVALLGHCIINGVFDGMQYS